MLHPGCLFQGMSVLADLKSQIRIFELDDGVVDYNSMSISSLAN